MVRGRKELRHLVHAFIEPAIEIHPSPSEWTVLSNAHCGLFKRELLGPGAVFLEVVRPTDLARVVVNDILQVRTFLLRLASTGLSELRNLLCVCVDHPSDVGGQRAPTEAVGPRVTRAEDALRVGVENDFGSRVVFVSERDELLECRIALLCPVSVTVRRDGLPLDRGETAKVLDLGQLLFPRQVVADVVVVQLSWPSVAGLLHQNRDRDSRLRPFSKDPARLFASLFALRSCVPAAVEDVQVGEVLDEALAQPVHVVRIEEGPVRHERDDATVLDPVGCPADGADVGVVEILQ